ncbi:hypothetical protein Tco_0924377 [Tanacetum coccineum]|uniref:Uncharacterized protein n=1 Tax=Tanacetum coccineum TaxID=301880 RepID=A0ABQ5D6P8_9ASTR
MMTATTAFIRGETAAASKKKVHTPWKSQDQSKRHTFERRSDFQNQPKDRRGRGENESKKGDIELRSRQRDYVPTLTANKGKEGHVVIEAGKLVGTCGSLRSTQTEAEPRWRWRYVMSTCSSRKIKNQMSIRHDGSGTIDYEHRLNIRERYHPVDRKGQVPRARQAFQGEISLALPIFVPLLDCIGEPGEWPLFFYRTVGISVSDSVVVARYSDLWHSRHCSDGLHQRIISMFSLQEGYALVHNSVRALVDTVPPIVISWSRIVRIVTIPTISLGTISLPWSVFGTAWISLIPGLLMIPFAESLPALTFLHICLLSCTHSSVDVSFIICGYRRTSLLLLFFLPGVTMGGGCQMLRSGGVQFGLVLVDSSKVCENFLFGSGLGFSPYESRGGSHHFLHSLWDVLVEAFCQFRVIDPPSVESRVSHEWGAPSWYPVFNFESLHEILNGLPIPLLNVVNFYWIFHILLLLHEVC